MIHRCRSFMRSHTRIKSQIGKSICYQRFGKGSSEVFGEFFSRLPKGNLEKAFKPFITHRPLFLYQKHCGGHLGRGDKGFGFDLEAESCTPYTLCQDRESREAFLTRLGSKLLSDLFLYHHQDTLARYIFECFQYNVGCNVVGEVGHQMIRLIQQRTTLPTLKHIATPKLKTPL